MFESRNDPTASVRLGQTTVTVTRLGLGTGSLGGLFRGVAEEEAINVVREAYDAGVRAFDTAPLYGFGLAEIRLGIALQTMARDSVTISTKIGRLLRRGTPADHLRTYYYPDVTTDLNPVFDFSYDATMRSFEESLERLGLDRIDVLYIHDPDDHWEQAIAGAYVALRQLREEGVVRAIGAGMMQAEMLARFAREGDFDCFLVAGRYTLLDQSALDELMPLCLQKGISLIVGSPYNTGILVDPTNAPTFDFMPAESHWIQRATRLKEICDRYDTPLMAAAIQFPLAHPAVAAVLTGARSSSELRQNLEMITFHVPAAVWEEARQAGLIAPQAPVPDW